MGIALDTWSLIYVKIPEHVPFIMPAIGSTSSLKLALMTRSSFKKSRRSTMSPSKFEISFDITTNSV